MAEITAQMVKELRERSGAGIMECKRALSESGGDIDEAELILRKRGIDVAQKKASRAANEGSIGSYIHAGSKLGVLVEINCETDFVARTDDFQSLVHDVAMHVAAADPRFISKDEVTEEAVQREKMVQRERALAEGKPEKIVDKIVDGRMGKFYEEVCLLEQVFVVDGESKISNVLKDAAHDVGGDVNIKGFVRFALGEGIEKQEENFAKEVAAVAAVAR